MENIIVNSPKIRNVLTEMTEVAQYLWERGWAEKNAGNISVNITGMVNEKSLDSFKNSPVRPLKIPYHNLKGTIFILTGTGTRMRDLARKPEENICFIRINETGNEYQQYCSGQADPNLQPTSELPTHLAVHDMFVKKNRDSRVVLHTHAIEIIALTQNHQFKSKESLNRILWGMHPETVLFMPEGVGFLPFNLPGTEKIAQATRKEFERHQAVIWEKHGVLSTGKNVIEAFDTIDILMKSAKIWFKCRNAGFEPEGLSDTQIEEIRKKNLFSVD